MSPRDHNRTLGIIHGLIGAFVLTGFTVAAVVEARRRPSDVAERLWWMLYVLPLPIFQLLTAFGLLMARRWGRIFALVLCALYVWLFPLGTLLAIYTWWFLHSEGGRQVYLKSETRKPL